MSSDYEVVLEFNRPPEDIRRMAQVLHIQGNLFRDNEDDRASDILYSADVMDEIATKMEKG